MAFGPDNDFSARRMTRAQAEAAEIDVGLRQYMLRVYNYMASGVAFTGIVAALVAANPALMQTIVGGPFKWVLFIGVLGLGFMAPRIIHTGSWAMAQGAFWLYAGLWGALIAPYFHFYTGASITRVFLITAAAFASLSLYGYTTKKDLAPMGKFLVMATFGILIALLVNMFIFKSSGIMLGLSIVVVLIFAGLTAYETQAIKLSYTEQDSADTTSRKAVMGAFMLYGTFITMFIYLMHIFGVARE